MIRFLSTISFFFLLSLLSGCQHPDSESEDPGNVIVRMVEATTDKACYAPGETVVFTLNKSIKATIRYWHLGDIIAEETISGDTWSWTLPSEDFKGYMVEVYNTSAKKTVGQVAVDVSSDWTRFPRYGFISDFGLKSESEIASVINNLSRYHINGLQYYDWMNDHHHPLAGTVDNPQSSWLDIIGRTNYLATVNGYINTAHEKGIASMWYDLCYGALEWAEEDGASWTWGLYKDAAHKELDFHPLDSFRSDIYLMNPGNPDWLDYFAARADEVYGVFGFDGYHIDQLGYRGKLYDYNGKSLNLEAQFGTFISKMKTTQPDKKLAFNAVSRYGQRYISEAPTDFLYNEIWDTPFSELKKVLDENHNFSKGEKNSVLAAYMNYKMKPKEGNFNTPAVLLTDAVIFALGGSHLELGEHMLCSEYFPNSDLSMSNDLKKALINYYDFLTAYENILRDGTVESNMTVLAKTNKVKLAAWGPEMGTILYLPRKDDNREIIHLINFTDATHPDWRDDSATQAEPKEINDFAIRFRSSLSPTRIWAASPDIEGGVPQMLEFTIAGGIINLSIPSLKYWTMVVIE